VVLIVATHILVAVKAVKVTNDIMVANITKITRRVISGLKKNKK
jgi:uncharacterized protein YycO